MAKIVSIDAMEILDSRGNPSLRVFLDLDDGVHASASVPSGASTGAHEAVELRDQDAKRYGGKGVLCAVQNVAQIAPHLIGLEVTRQRDIDKLLIDLDGSADKSNFGANAILGVSMAAARAAAKASRLPLYAYLGGRGAHRLPVPMMNVINGGAHADNSLDFQEFMLVPLGAPTFDEAVRYGAEVFHTLKALLQRSGHITSVGDEGGFAPKFTDNAEACDWIVRAITSAGYIPGEQLAIAIDPAASAFRTENGYELSKSGAGAKSSRELIDTYAAWVDQYPVVSIEDGLAEDDWTGFKDLTATLGRRIQIVGDDIFVTNKKFIERGIAEKTANAVLIKLNQIGTISETIDAIDLCRSAGWEYVISHRSGETEDTFIADFAVAMGASQIKTGSLCRSERVAKYNRLLEIERLLGENATFRSPFRHGRD